MSTCRIPRVLVATCSAFCIVVLRQSGMVIGVLQFELLIPSAESLKDKRRVIRSVRDRLHREHLVSVAEVASQEILNVAVMGLACVGTDGARVGEVLDHIGEKLRSLPDAELGDCSRQIIHGSQLVDSAAASEPALDAEALAREMLARADETEVSEGERGERTP